MIIDVIWFVLAAFSLFYALLTGHAGELAPAVFEGASLAVTVCLSAAGAVCLWSGLLRLMQDCGMLSVLGKLLRPVLRASMPGLPSEEARDAVSANMAANLLGVGNAATPAGLKAASLITASGDLGSLIIINCCSIQLIPSTLCAIRAGLGAAAPFDILPAVWLTSACSLCAALGTSFLFRQLAKRRPF